MVVPRTGEAKIKGLDTGKGHRSFKKRGAFFISDPAEAEEIDMRYGLKGRKQAADVWVHEDPMYEWHLHNDGSNGANHDIHRNFHGPNKKFADAWEQFEKRRKDKKKEED